MKNNQDPYTLGVAIGTNMIGFSAINEQNQPIRVKGQSVLALLWNTKQNLNQILTDDAIAGAIYQANLKTPGQSLEKLMANAYLSPQNKKAINQAIKVVNDLTMIFTRGNP